MASLSLSKYSLGCLFECTVLAKVKLSLCTLLSIRCILCELSVNSVFGCNVVNSTKCLYVSKTKDVLMKITLINQKSPIQKPLECLNIVDYQSMCAK